MRNVSCSRMGLLLWVVVGCLLVVSRVSRGDFTLGTPSHLGPIVNSSVADITSSISTDGLALYFASERSGGYGGGDDIWLTTRETTDDDWGPPINLGSIVNSSACEMSPSISSDGLSLFFCDGVWDMGFPQRPGGYGSGDLWVSTWTDDSWSQPVNLGAGINSVVYEGEPEISADGLSLYFSSNRPGGLGGLDLWITTRVTKDDEWSAPVNLGPTVNSPSSDGDPTISSDGLTLLFASSRPSGEGHFDLWMTKRGSKHDDWGSPINLGPIINTSGIDWGPDISHDGSTLYFCSKRSGGVGYYDLWQIETTPKVDLNEDRIVDVADVCIMIDHWLTNEPLCDIAPPPFGDGVIDVQDLIVLAEHLFEDYRLVAHWALDEDAGNTAYDSASKYDANLQGGPIWQPDGGKVGGALQFDGIDDYVSTPFVLNPSEGSFSVFAWIYSWMKGQVIISESNTTGARGSFPGSIWLCTDPSNGGLMTGLMETTFGPLKSDLIITDGQWHHIGLVYDRALMKRYLYIDGAEVAVDSDLIGGIQTTGCLYIGAGQALDATSFFCGLIDDVRIYDTVLSAEEIAILAQ